MRQTRGAGRILVLAGTLVLVGCGAGGMAPPTGPGAAGAGPVAGCDVHTPCARPTGDGTVTSNVGDFGFTAPAEPPAHGGAVSLGVTYRGTAPTKISVGSKRADLRVLQGDREVYRWSQGRMFTMIVFSEDWAPSQSRTFTLDGVPALKPGAYTAQFFFYGGGGAADAPVLVTQWTVGSH